MSARKKILAAIFAALAAFGILYIRFLEPRWLEVKKTEIRIMSGSDDRNPASPIRILHLTDLHLSSEVPLPFLMDAFRTAVRQQPDLICLTGDYITHTIPDAARYSEALRILSRAAPTFACPGNHDGGIWAGKRGGYPSVEEISTLLENSGITFLENRAKAIVMGGKTVLVAGVGDIFRSGSGQKVYQRPL